MMPIRQTGGMFGLSTTIYILILEFFIFSCLGWLMEVILKYIQFRRFINRGFLIGPYCPIYGWGVGDFSRRFCDMRCYGVFCQLVYGKAIPRPLVGLQPKAHEP